MTNNYLFKRISLFIALKISEVGLVSILTFGSYFLGKFVNDLFDFGFSSKFTLWNLGLLSVLISLATLALLAFLVGSWLLSNWRLTEIILKKKEVKNDSRKRSYD